MVINLNNTLVVLHFEVPVVVHDLRITKKQLKLKAKLSTNAETNQSYFITALQPKIY